MQALGHIVLGLVQHGTDMRFGLGQQGRGTLDQVPVCLLGLDHEQDHVHETGQAWCNANLADRRHVENDVVKITGLQLRHQVPNEYLFQSVLLAL